tara:strand:- start:71 stop:439 length:369 start_codon:yes stop_codon:yes gene_type:complete
MAKKKEQQRTTDKKVAMIKALGTTFGNVSDAIRLLDEQGLSLGRTAHYTWLQDDKDYQQAVEDAADKTLDLVEKALIKQIKNGSVQATTFYLKTKGRVRGYNERQEVDITSGDDPISININI